MKKSNTFIIIVLLIALLTNPVFGYPGMGGNNSGVNMGNITQNESEKIDLANTTQSDLDIKLIQHLIEVDAAMYEEQNKIYVRETIVFKNTGDTNFQGTLRTWVPDGAEEIKVGKAPMVMSGSVVPINAIQNGNIISWQDNITKNNQPFPMYAVEYVLPAQAEGTLVKSRHFTKKFVFPTLINKVPLNIVIKVTKSQGETVSVKDEIGSNIQSSVNPTDGDNSILYSIETPQFKEVDIEFSKSALDLSQIGLYLIILLIIVLVLAYPVIRKKSSKLQKNEGKIGNSLKREPESEEQKGTEEETSDEDTYEEEPEEREEEESTPEDLSGKSKDQLKTEKSELLSKLKKLEIDYASGGLIDEEYEELRNSYQGKLKKIERRIE